jgi:hypothetical protein
MTHYCTACSSEFDDDSITPANADFVHCVFCGARIALARRADAHAPTSMVPFSRDYEREEAFALGVINHSGPGFPDTLRQFRVPSAAPRPDSLSPLTPGSEPPSTLPARAPRRVASLSLSLSVGFGVGVAIAFAAVSLRPRANAPRAAAAHVTQTPAAATVRAPMSSPASATPAASPLPAAAGPLPTAASAAPPALREPVAAVTLAHPAASKPPSAEQYRRWLLERARTEQRQYHLTAAEQLYRQVLVRAPRDSEALSGLGELDLLRGTVDLASAHFREALEANANYIPALVAAADLDWQAGRTDDARRAYLDIVDHYSPDSYPPYVALRSTPVASPPCER